MANEPKKVRQRRSILQIPGVQTILSSLLCIVLGLLVGFVVLLLIDQYDIRSGQGATTIARSMSGGNQQKAIVAREIDRSPHLLIAMQPTRGLDVGAIEYIHKQIIAARDEGKAVLLVSLEMDEVLDVSDRILVMYEGEIVGELDPKTTTAEEIGLYMAGAKREVR